MPISEAFLTEFDHEMATTRRAIERVPADKFTWKPHDKSMTMVRLTGHIAEMPGWAVPTMQQTSLDIAPVDGPKRVFGNVRVPLDPIKGYDPEGGKEQIEYGSTRSAQ